VIQPLSWRKLFVLQASHGLPPLLRQPSPWMENNAGPLLGASGA
jgi:hypothetical protein